MALSNMLNEPRREITETLVGAVCVLVPLAAFLYCDYQFGLWIAGLIEPGKAPLPLVMVGMLAGVGLTMALCGLTIVVHAAGDDICTALDRRGLRLRPARRP